MTASIDALKIRKRLGRDAWMAPIEWGPDGWLLRKKDASGLVIASVASFGGDDWIHASISSTNGIPTYDDLKHVHDAVFGDGYAYQVFAPPSDHINHHEYCLHLWGRLDGSPQLPNFAEFGTI